VQIFADPVSRFTSCVAQVEEANLEDNGAPGKTTAVTAPGIVELTPGIRLVRLTFTSITGGNQKLGVEFFGQMQAG
jgi:hypothetical protein